MEPSPTTTQQPRQDLVVFPVKVVLDTNTGKYHKKPQVASWIDYQITARELATAKHLGIVPPDNRVVFDLDNYKGVTTAQVDAALGVALDWPSALIQRTPSGGTHYAFTLEPGQTCRQGTDLLGIPGFDTRSARKGWIASGELYPDETITGLPYAIIDDPLPPLPEEALAILNATAGPGTSAPANHEPDDLDFAIAAQPLADLTIDQLAAYLDRLPPEDVERYETWIKTGMAICHQTQGSAEGFELWADRVSKPGMPSRSVPCRHVCPGSSVKA